MTPGHPRRPPEPPTLVSLQYENQTKLLGKWSGRGLPGRPGFSDITGKARLPRHRIQPPKGWRWDGPWAVEPQRR